MQTGEQFCGNLGPPRAACRFGDACYAAHNLSGHLSGHLSGLAGAPRCVLRQRCRAIHFICLVVALWP